MPERPRVIVQSDGRKSTTGVLLGVVRRSSPLEFVVDLGNGAETVPASCCKVVER